jgi:3-oxoacyl-[acyl-carrier-protein] synthase II
MGYALSADGYHATAPHPEGEGAARAIKAALAAGGIKPEEVRYVNSHGTGTAKNDPAETAATKVGLGDAARNVAVSSTKSMIGHLLGAAGAVENIVTVQALIHQIVPPTSTTPRTWPARWRWTSPCRTTSRSVAPTRWWSMLAPAPMRRRPRPPSTASSSPALGQ